MSKQNNLEVFLQDVADSIRAKKGTSAKINPQMFSQEIDSIPTTGNATAASPSISVRARGNDIY